MYYRRPGVGTHYAIRHGSKMLAGLSFSVQFDREESIERCNDNTSHKGRVWNSLNGRPISRRVCWEL